MTVSRSSLSERRPAPHVRIFCRSTAVFRRRGSPASPLEDGQAILWTPDGSPDGVLQSLGTLGGSRSAGLSINEAGEIVGWSKLAGDAESRPFLWNGAAMDSLPLLGGTQGEARWINNVGQVVGTSTTATDGLQQFAVLWEDDTVTQLPPIIAGQNHLVGFIHDNGDIAGSVRTPGPMGGFVRRAAIWRDGGLFLTLGTLADGSEAEPFATSWASGINASGVVVGMSVNAASALVPFVYRDGDMVQLDDLMPEPWIADFVGDGAINDAGQIVVSGFMPGQGSRALLLTPIQAPSSVPGDPVSSDDTVVPTVTPLRRCLSGETLFATGFP